jgi:uncharacterized protein YacL
MKITYKFNDDFLFHFEKATLTNIILYYIGYFIGFILGIIILWWCIMEMGGMHTLSDKIDITYKIFHIAYEFLDMFFGNLDKFLHEISYL